MPPRHGVGTSEQPIDLVSSDDEPARPAAQPASQRRRPPVRPPPEPSSTSEDQSTTDPYEGMDIVARIKHVSAEAGVNFEAKRAEAERRSQSRNNSQASGSQHARRLTDGSADRKGKGVAGPSQRQSSRDAIPMISDSDEPAAPPPKRLKRNGSLRDALLSQAGPSQAGSSQAGPSRATQSRVSSAFKESAWTDAKPLTVQPHRPLSKPKEPEGPPPGSWGNFEPITTQPHVPGTQSAKSTPSKPQTTPAKSQGPPPKRQRPVREQSREAESHLDDQPSQAANRAEASLPAAGPPPPFSDRPAAPSSQLAPSSGATPSSQIEPFFEPSSPSAAGESSPAPPRRLQKARKTTSARPPRSANSGDGPGPSTRATRETQTPQPAQPAQPPSAPSSARAPRWKVANALHTSTVSPPLPLPPVADSGPIDNGPSLDIGDDLIGDNAFEDAALPSAAAPGSSSGSTPTAATPKAATLREATPKAATPKAVTPQAPTPKAVTPQAATPKAATPKVATPMTTRTPSGVTPKPSTSKAATASPNALAPKSATAAEPTLTIALDPPEAVPNGTLPHAHRDLVPFDDHPEDADESSAPKPVVVDGDMAETQHEEDEPQSSFQPMVASQEEDSPGLARTSQTKADPDDAVLAAQSGDIQAGHGAVKGKGPLSADDHAPPAVDGDADVAVLPNGDDMDVDMPSLNHTPSLRTTPPLDAAPLRDATPSQAGPSALGPSPFLRSPSQPATGPWGEIDPAAWARATRETEPEDERNWILCGKKNIEEPVDPPFAPAAVVLSGSEIPPPDRKGKARRNPEEESRRFLWKWTEIAPKVTENPALHCSMFEAYVSMSTSEDMLDEAAAPELTVDPSGNAAPPFEFFYSNDMVYHPSVPDPELGAGCDCEGPCDPLNDNCLCVRRQKAYFYKTGTQGFNYRDGKLVDGDCSIWECGPKCGCPPECSNRVIQRGRGKNVKIELFKTKQRGWGVRSLSAIPKGTFIGIYAGELITEAVSDDRAPVYDRTNRTYLFDLDGYQIGNPPPREELQAIDPRLAELAYACRDRAVAQSTPEELARGTVDRYAAYAVDAFHYGFTRFFNHSCNPNMRIAQAYVTDFHPERPLLAIFTTRNIAADEELTISYKGEKSVDDKFMHDDEHDDEYVPKKQTPKHTPKRGSNTKSTVAHGTGMGRKALCLCGAAICNGNMFTWDLTEIQ